MTQKNYSTSHPIRQAACTLTLIQNFRANIDFSNEKKTGWLQNYFIADYFFSILKHPINILTIAASIKVERRVS